jgi:hypothetical protein
MPDILTIPKTSSSFPPYLDFNKFREAGIQHIEDLGSDLWTDYNLHDPGITILEVLCYALTDLGYRNNFDIKDLLTRSWEQKNREQRTVFGQPFDDNFFTAAEILTCNPVTIDDFRKLLLDIPGVRSAWLQKAPEGELPLYLDKARRRLRYDVAPNGSESDRLCLRGLYDVCIETEPLLVADACGSVFFSENDILDEVYSMLNAHRNLCEDFREVILFGKEQISVCADIELAPFADAEEVLLEIYKQVEEFLSPTIRFYTLQEMLEKGRPVEEIFEGRPLSPRSHGFIDPVELRKLDPRSELHASDLYRVIMDVKGVLAVRNLSMANAIDGVPLTTGERWCIPLTPKYRPHFDLDRSRITFFKGILPFNADKKEVQQRYKEEKAAAMKAYLDPYQLDLPIPEGTHRDLEDYTSIMEEFPLTYGTGEAGIKDIPTAQRHGQARQLKGYLLFFDQLLANYLAQLARVRELFSMRPDEHEFRSGNDRTYFVHLMQEVPGIEELVLNFGECAANDEDPPPPEDYPSYLAYIAESIETYRDRRNRFLDHLLARFAESFSDYVLLMFEVNGKRHDDARILRDKANFLQSYPEISRNRGRGFDYTQPSDWCNRSTCEDENAAPNISGFEMRIARILGITDAGQKRLAHSGVAESAAGWGWSIKTDGEDVLSSILLWPTEEAACADLENLPALLGSETYYRRLTFERAGSDPEFGFLLTDEAGLAIARSSRRYSDPVERDQAIHLLISRIQLPGIAVQAVQETDCFFFELYDYTGGALLLRSLRGFGTAAAVFAFFDTPDDDNDLLGWALNRDNYEIIERNGRFSFVLNDNEGEIAALHHQYYDTEEACEDRLRAVIYYLDDIAPQAEIVEEAAGDFLFEISDEAGRVIWQSVQSYPTQSEAHQAAALARALSRHRIYYRLIDDHDGELPFGFELLHRNGSLLAMHPHWYATDCARDLAMDATLYGSQNFDAQNRILEQQDGFHYELLNPEGAPLVRGLAGYPDEETAEAEWHAFLELAVRVSNYRLTDAGAGDCPYGFEIVNAAGEAVAASAMTYATLAESEMAMRAVLNFLCHTEWHVAVTGTPGIYHFSVTGFNGRTLLSSIHIYPDEPTARAALRHALEAARETANYFHLPDFGFELRDAGGNPLASHPQTYADEEQREAAINLIVNYVRNDAPIIDSPNTGGAFYAVIYDRHGRLVFRGTQLYANREDALAGLEMLLQLAACPENYLAVANGNTRCSFGFSLINEEGHVVARHPLHYPSAAASNRAMRAVFALLTHGEALTDKVIERYTHFRFELINGDGAVLFSSKEIFGTAQEATEAAAQFQTIAGDTASFQNFSRGNGFGFIVRDAQSGFSTCADQLYNTAAERNAAVEAIVLFIRLRSAPYQLLEDNEHWTFALGNETETNFLQSTGSFEERADAVAALLQLFDWAQDEARYLLLQENVDGNERYGFALTDEADEAVSDTVWFDTEAERDTAVASFIVWLTGLNPEPLVVNLPDTFGFILRDFSGNLIVQSAHSDYSSEAAAQAAWTAMITAMFDPANSSIFEIDYDNSNCRYRVQILVNDVVIATAPQFFHSRSAAQIWIAELRDLLEQHTVQGGAAGTTCGYYFTLSHECHDEEGAPLNTVTLTGTQHYPTASDALRAGHESSALLSHPELFTAEEEDDGWRLVWRDEEGNLLAAGDQVYADEETAIADRDCMTASLQDAPGLSCENSDHAAVFFRERAFYCRVSQEETTLLESVRKVPVGAVWPANVMFRSSSARELKIRDAIAFFHAEDSFQPATDIVEGEDGKFRYSVNIDGLRFESQEAYDDADAATETYGLLFNIGKERANYRLIDEENCTHTFELLDATAESQACERCRSIHEQGQDESNFTLITNEEECLYSFELADPHGDAIACHPVFYDSAEARSSAIAGIIGLLNCEGLHLVEHLLLRPRRRDLDRLYNFELTDTTRHLLLLHSVGNFSSREEASAALAEMFRSIWKYKEGETDYIRIVDDLDDLCRFSFEILAPDAEGELQVIAMPAGACHDAEHRDEMLNLILDLLTEEPSGIPALPEPFKAKVNPLRLSEELIGDQLLLPVCDCGDDACDLSPRRSDPYSFRATVVLPYWPARFLQPEFRAFVETTLRQEAPAHIFLRICWVDPCQMAAFEAAYCRWLAVKAAGDQSCDASIALNNLIDILSRLRNIYPAASLHDCEEPAGNANRVILNYSIIGSANSSSHDD